MFPRRDVLVDQCLLDGRGALRFMDRGWGGVDVGEQVGRSRLTGFADVDHVPRPLGVPFLAIARLGIVGGFEPFRGRGQRTVGLEADARDGGVAVGGHLARGPLVVALPGLPKRGNHG